MVKPGERQTIDIPLAPLVTNSELGMPLTVVVGKRAGPTLVVIAALHGDEISGVEIIRRILRHKAIKSMAGTLIAVPVVNVHGFLNQTRYLPDGRDLNRSFPGSSSGSLASRVANSLIEKVISRADCVIDLHTATRHRINLPQLRVDLGKEDIRELVMSFGVPVVIESRVKDGSLREAAHNMDIPYLLYEGGESLRFDEFSIRVGVHGVLNIMRHMKLLRRSRRRTSLPSPMITRRTIWTRATTSGVLRNLAKLGQAVSEGQVLAIIGDPMGNQETAVYSPDDGIIIGKLNLPLVNEGDATFHVACYRDRNEDAEQAISDLQETFAGPGDEGLL